MNRHAVDTDAIHLQRYALQTGSLRRLLHLSFRKALEKPWAAGRTSAVSALLR